MFSASIYTYLAIFWFIILILQLLGILCLNNNIISLLIVLSIILIFYFEIYKKKMEGMRNVSMCDHMGNEEEMDSEELTNYFDQHCPEKMCTPGKYTLNYIEEDLGKTGLYFDNDLPKQALIRRGEFDQMFMPYSEVRQIVNKQKYNSPKKQPGYYLFNNGKFYEDNIPYDKASDLICASKVDAIIQQRNFNVNRSPHTHLGKARGYLNPDPIYE